MLFLDVLKENPMFMQKKEMEKSNYKQQLHLIESKHLEEEDLICFNTK